MTSPNLLPSAIPPFRRHDAPVGIAKSPTPCTAASPRSSRVPATTIGFDKHRVCRARGGEGDPRCRRGLELPPSVRELLERPGPTNPALQSAWLISLQWYASTSCSAVYESYIHPLTILSTLPSAGVGALLALMLAGQDLGVIAIIGIILLIGIVKKNAIMMIDFAIDAERNEGKAPRDAIHQAALLRFRPILMTTFAALFAAFR